MSLRNQKIKPLADINCLTKIAIGFSNQKIAPLIAHKQLIAINTKINCLEVLLIILYKSKAIQEFKEAHIKLMEVNGIIKQVNGKSKLFTLNMRQFRFH